MKKITCIILSILIITGSLLLPATVYAQGSEPETIEQISHQIEVMFGDTLEEEAAQSGSWGYEYKETSSPDELTSIEFITPSLGGVCTPQWGNQQDENVPEKNHEYGTHGYIIKKANTASGYPLGGGDSGTVSYRKLVYEISKRCDTEHGPNCGSNFCTELHANGDYLTSLMFLWRFAKGLENNTLNGSDKKVYIKQSADEVYDFMPAKTRTETVDANGTTIKSLNDLRNKSVKIVQQYYNTDLGKVTGQTWKKRCKYIVWGMVLHLIGDVYAHKVILKTDAADLLQEQYGNYFSQLANGNQITTLTEYIFYPNYLSPSYFCDIGNGFDVKELINAVQKKSDDYQDGLPLFQIKKFVDNEKKKKESHSLYADNPQFYPKRVPDAIISSTYFMTNFNKSNITAKTVIECLTSVNNFSFHLFPKYEKIIKNQ